MTPAIRACGRTSWLVSLLVVLWTGPTVAQDAEPGLADQVNQVLASIEGSERVTARVENGVVTLSGMVLEADRARAMEEAVSRVPGVLAVNNDIRLDLAVGSRIDPMRERLLELGNTTLALLPLLAVAAVVVVLFWMLSRLARRAEFLLRHVARSQPLRDLIARSVSALVFLVGIVLALDIVGATAVVGGVLGAAGVVGIAIGFAFRDLIENYIASIMLSVRQPFRPDDHVIIDQHEGIVVRLTSRSTLLLTPDGNSLRLPNAMVFKSVILNYSNTPERRFHFSVGVGYGEDLEDVQLLGVETLQAVEGVLSDPGPIGRIQALADSTVTVQFFAWVDQRRHPFGKVRSDALARVKRVFAERGVDTPEPAYQVRLLQETGEAVTERRPSVTDTAVEDIERAEDQQARFLQRKAEEGRADGDRNLIDGEARSE
ncbi:MAG: mechanosensitive ion channel family protein [Xanthomonadales bacterium]|nr:mechanosensitive ion channel family protein [Xanthomonadales bacterium]